MSEREINFDGLVGPTHNYSGLSFGNLASRRHAGEVANPRLAALQGLDKMKALADRGFAQGVLPPHERPSIPLLRQLGFGGSEREVIVRAAREVPELYAASLSASAMWAANAATVSPSADTADGRVHFTPANLVTKLHRSLEPPVTARILKAIFPDAAHFAHHPPLVPNSQLADEGAANHTRFAPRGGGPGVGFFVYGAHGFDPAAPGPRRFPPRQTREASEAMARLHGLDPARTVFAQQSPEAIDGGVFHNDVIAVGTGAVLLCHEKAFLDQPAVIGRLRETFGGEFTAIEVAESEVSLADAVQTYLFNSQLLAKPGGKILLAAPEECRTHDRVARFLENLLASGGPIDEVIHFNLRESMRNGGGPACLRLRVPLTRSEVGAMNRAALFDDALYARLRYWVENRYRDRLAPGDLADPLLLTECREALDELTEVLELGSVYPFQLP